MILDIVYEKICKIQMLAGFCNDLEIELQEMKLELEHSLQELALNIEMVLENN